MCRSDLCDAVQTAHQRIQRVEQTQGVVQDPRQLGIIVHKRQLNDGGRHHTHLRQTHTSVHPLPRQQEAAGVHKQMLLSHHHGDEREEVPVALDSSEPK